MTPQVTLTIKSGSLAGHKYEFETPQYCTIGRAADCDIKLPPGYEYCTVSRHHCLLDISPPEIHVRDCGSRNGTQINGMQIGHPASWYVCVAPCTPLPEYALHDGDELRLGDAVFQVGIAHPAEATPAWAQEETDRTNVLACV
jgi:eukaryotic-like serine/threonine-protein kinase